MKPNIKRKLHMLIIFILAWVLVSNTIQAFKCPEMTNTELFLHLPKSFICDWIYCE